MLIISLKIKHSACVLLSYVLISSAEYLAVNVKQRKEIVFS